ncbi:MAG: hypothetical protein PUG50_03600 [Eubacteriales bacterium]|uniref:hypothetical protein n=1 Tax=Fenollaria sp. TaxID=1965292 RepID=UPI0025E0BC7A|nr:hypothetical protein [Fenollaria sp.]MDD7339654.1 hypothetical protein [Eubacteriales bacterium]MDY3106440.1 hypothetical protein [Fenollaria sp.]
MKKSAALFVLLLLSILTLISCNRKEKSTETNNRDYYLYKNDKYGFTLEIPEWNYNIQLFNVNDDSGAEEYGYEKQNDDATTINFMILRREKDLDISFYTAFELIVSEKSNLDSNLTKLGEKDGKTYYYKELKEDDVMKEIKNRKADDKYIARIKNLIKELEPMHKEIINSFKFIDA